AADCTVLKDSPEIVFGEREQPLDFRRDEFFTRGEGSVRRGGSVAIPGTDILANVAAEKLPTASGAKFFVDAFTQLDGEIRDAASRVEHVGLDEGTGRAGIQTQRAIATEIGRRHGKGIGAFAWEGRRQVERSEHDAEEKPGAQILVDEACVLGQPTEPGV